VKKLVSRARLPIIVLLSAASPETFVFTYLFRIQDGITILNRIIDRWDHFHFDFEQDHVITEKTEEEIRLETIETTYSFVTFLFLVLGFYKGVLKQIVAVASDLRLDIGSLVEYPKESGPILTLRTIRNKMVAHTADIEPRADDSLPNRLAYLEWYVGHWGSHQDTRNRRLNTFGLGVGRETSTHVVPPSFEGMVDAAQSFICLCEEAISRNTRYLVEHIEGNNSEEYAFVGYYP